MGCPRSGTTLVAAKLDDSAELAVTPETHFLTEWLPRFPGLRTGRRDEFERFWTVFQTSDKFRWLGLEHEAVHEKLLAGQRWDAQAVFSCLLSTYAALHGKPRVGEKTPTHYRALDTLFGWYPSARAVFVVRDPRSVVASYFDLAEEASWARGTAFEVARRWNDATTCAQRWHADRRVTLVRYEALVRQPLAELERLRTMLGLGGASGPPEPTRPARSGAGEQGLAPSAEISADRVERWRSRLSSRDLQVVERVCGPGMRSMGYEGESQMSAGGVAALVGQATSTVLTGVKVKIRSGSGS